VLVLVANTSWARWAPAGVRATRTERRSFGSKSLVTQPLRSSLATRLVIAPEVSCSCVMSCPAERRWFGPDQTAQQFQLPQVDSLRGQLSLDHGRVVGACDGLDELVDVVLFHWAVAARRLDGHDGHAAELALLGRDVLGQGRRGGHLVEDRALLGDVAADVERSVAQEFVEGSALLLGHADAFRGPSGWGGGSVSAAGPG